MAYAPPKFCHRRTLEILVDSCSMGAVQLRAVEEIIQFIQSADPKVYDDYRIVLPVQIGAEVRQRIFPDFLYAELSIPLEQTLAERNTEQHHTNTTQSKQRPSGLRQFFKQHIDHLDIAETDISLAYKLHYFRHASAVLLESPALMQNVVAHARWLHKRYHDASDTSYPSLDDLIELQRKLIPLILEERDQFGKKGHDITNYYRASQNTSDVTIHINRAEISGLAKLQKRIEHELSPAQRYLFQAMYSEPELHQKAIKHPEFAKFRLDKGERAVERYLFEERRKPDQGLVSLVISNDKGAREGINQLRNESRNKVLVLSNKGVCTTSHFLKSEKSFIEACEKTMPSTKISQREKSYTDRRKERADANGSTITDNPKPDNKLNEATEHEWSRRAAEVLRYGDWRKLYRPPLSAIEHERHPAFSRG